MAKTFHGKSMKLGGGGRFAKGKSELMSKGYSQKSAGAIMASAGRKKYGSAKMAKMSAKGRRGHDAMSYGKTGGEPVTHSHAQQSTFGGGAAPAEAHREKQGDAHAHSLMMHGILKHHEAKG